VLILQFNLGLVPIKPLK